MSRIIRTPTRAEGGLTDKEKEQAKKYSEKWISNAFKTGDTDKGALIDAIKRMYKEIGVKDVRVVVVPSPLVMACAYGIANIWWKYFTRETNKRAATDATTAAASDASDAASDATRHAIAYATRAAIDDATHAAIDAASRAASIAAYNAIDATTNAATQDAIRAAILVVLDALDATVLDALDATVLDALDATYAALDAATATRDVTRDAIDDAIHNATHAAILDVTHNASDAATYDAIHNATDATTNAATQDAILAATLDATRAATRAATHAATLDATRAATRAATDATRDALDDATHAATAAATDDVITGDDTKHKLLFGLALYFARGNKKIAKEMLKSIEYWENSYQGGNMWSGWCCYCEFCRDVLGLTGLEGWDKYKPWEDAAKLGGFRVMHEKFCLVSEFPQVLKIDSQNRPHCTNGPSHRWKDGYEIYHLNGIRVPKWLVMTDAGKIDPQLALDEKNVDVQREIIRKIGAERMLKKLNAKPIDEFIDNHTNGGNRYQLMEMKIGAINRKYLYYEHASLPGVFYAKPVPPDIKKALHARAWILSIGDTKKLMRMPDDVIKENLPQYVS